MKAKWTVEVPISIAETYEVEADTMGEAIKQAYQYVFHGGYDGVAEETWREVEDTAQWQAECVYDPDE